ncbi:hypothetical protein [Bdellovibrio sp. HCB337]|uniref:hypothetical protein n=1 Tax=Bdellovibrio sp. HCB337 TaxID=3394358 RepID=UPI0039A65F1F
MKTFASLLVFGLTTTQFALAAIPMGSFKVIDAYCSNPQYVNTPEEQDYIDTLKGIKGSCIDGKFTSPPCFEDYYVFTTATTGSFVTRSSFMPGVACVTTTEMTYSENPPGVLEMLLGKSTGHSESNDPNTSISCDGGGESGETSRASYHYKVDGEFLLLIMPGPAGSGSTTDCGDYVFKAKSVTDFPK